jgi:hypothetical protein
MPSATVRLALVIGPPPPALRVDAPHTRPVLSTLEKVKVAEIPGMRKRNPANEFWGEQTAGSASGTKKSTPLADKQQHEI